MKSSEEKTASNTGVLILAYGGGTTWNKTLQNAIKPLKENFEVEIAFGMANYISIRNGIQALENVGVHRIVVVQLFISSHSPLIQQNEFLLGKRTNLPFPPLPMMQYIDEFKQLMGVKTENTESPETSHPGDHTHSKMYFPEKLEPIPHSSEIILTPALDNHPIVALILHQRIQELSLNPANETILLVAHGPIDEEYNRRWLQTMENISQQIQQHQLKSGTPYKQIFCVTVRDDAPEPVFEQAKSHLRALVRQANTLSNVIVIPLFLSPGGREKAIAQRLKGLDFIWNGKTLLPDALLTKYLQDTLNKSLRN